MSQAIAVTSTPAVVGLPQANAIDLTLASESGLIILRGASGTLMTRPGATEILVNGFAPGHLPPIGSVVKIWGVKLDQGPFFLPFARCTSHGAGILGSSATFVQVLSPSEDAVGIPQPNAVDIRVASESGLMLLSGASGTLTLRDGATELLVNGFAPGYLPPVGTSVKIWGVALDTGSFFLPNARCVSHGGGILRNSATFLQLVLPPNK